jgi:phosphatidylserine/phosphatidylglycerophosphate/cardiolipin synthase-like enzyme
LAIAGTHVVLMGWDMTAAALRSKKVLGFAIERTRHRDGEVIWLGGMKTFQTVAPDPGPGVLVSSREHPIQSFQWADYSVAPGERYSYRVVARVGTPASLKNGPQAKLEVETEGEHVGKHSVFFNRGAVASQEYARRFQNDPPDKRGQAAWDWLSRGLVEALEAYIGQADSGDELHGAFFEFKHPRVFAALKQAKKRGAKLFIIYDGKDQLAGNRKAISDAKVKSWLPEPSHLRPRKRSGKYAHNKFLVLSKNGTPRQVWTGSTNLSENGLFGHSNNAHVVRDPKVAKAFKSYWDRLWVDPPKATLAQENLQAAPVPTQPLTDETVPVFSPLPDLKALEWYAKLAGRKHPLFMTFAFGMNKKFVPIYARKDGLLRFALMEKAGNGSQIEQQTKEVNRVRRLPNTVVAIGDNVDAENTFERWLKERVKIVNDAHVLFVHTKYLLSDPLGSDPVIVVGSANFSDASSITNDENMLVIRGNATLADIYLGEFMRLHTHYAYRESLHFRRTHPEQYEKRRRYLVESSDWILGEGTRTGEGYFDKGSARALRRAYFSRLA